MRANLYRMIEVDGLVPLFRSQNSLKEISDAVIYEYPTDSIRKTTRWKIEFTLPGQVPKKKMLYKILIPFIDTPWPTGFTEKTYLPDRSNS